MITKRHSRQRRSRQRRSRQRRSKQTTLQSIKKHSKKSRRKNNNIIDGVFDIKEIHESLSKKPHLSDSLIIDKTTHPELNEEMYKILLDWINGIIIFNNFPRVYFYNTINYLKRYSKNTKGIKRKEFQLIGSVCLMITDKFLERYPKIKPKYIEYITDASSKVDQVIDMEKKILESLNFELYIPTPYHFFDIYNKGFLIPLTDDEIDKSQFLLEFPNVNYLHSYEPSIIALATILCVKNINYSDLPDDTKKALNLNEDNINLLNKYIGYLSEFKRNTFKNLFELKK